MQIRDLLPPQPVEVVGADANVVDAARRMLEHDVGLLPVVDGDRLVGVVTDRDIVLRCVAQEKMCKGVTVRDVMSVEVVVGYDDQTVDEVRAIMVENGIQRLPVSDRNDHLVGIVSLLNLEGRPDPQKKPVKVTMYKEKTDSYGRPHKVPLRTVYVTTGKLGDEDAKITAAKVVEEERRSPLNSIADGVYTEKLPGKDD